MGPRNNRATATFDIHERYGCAIIFWDHISARLAEDERIMWDNMSARIM
jgi:hypothetical protein